MDSEIFEKMQPTKLFFKCAIPAVITSVFGALYSVVDGIFVGRYLGENALAAINLIMPIIMIVEAISNMLATGASVNISILLGKQKRQEASKVFTYSIKIIVLFSCIIGAVGLVFAKSFITFISPKATEEAICLATDYLRVFALFAPVIPIYFATDNYLRVCGKQELSMAVGIVTQLMNVVLDIVLIAFLHLGIKAAAVASCLSIAIGSVVTLFAFTHKKLDLYYTKGKIKANQLLKIIANGSSELFSNISMSIMSVVMNLFLLKYGGTTAVAAFSVVMYVDSIIGMVNFGICDSLQPAISYCYGAGLFERMKEIFKRVVLTTVVTSFAAFLFMLFVGPAVANIFVKPGDYELLQVGKTAIKIFAFSYLVGWIDMCFSSFFTAIDRPVHSFLISFFGTFVFPVIFLFVLTSLYGLNGVWLMATVAGMASAILTMGLAKSLKKKIKTGANNE